MGDGAVVTLLLVATAVFWGSTPILEKTGLARVDPMVGVTVRSAVITAALLFLSLLTGRGRALFDIDRGTFLIFGASGVLSGVFGMLTYYSALKIGATSRIVPLAATYPLVAALLSVLILREEITLQRAIGTALIVSGVWLVK
jgi:bacterial/archaeal transporter family protein